MSQSGTYNVNTVILPVETLTGDVGGVVSPTAGNIDILGGNNITTTGNPGTSTITIDLTGTTQYAVQVGNATGSLTSLAVGATNQVLLGNTGGDPSWGQVDLTTDVTGILPVANGGTGVASLDVSKTIYVTKSGDDANSGRDIFHAKLTIQAAVTLAVAGDTILVYPGTYTETITHAASDVSVFAMGDSTNCIIQNTDANVIDFNTQTGIVYKFFRIQVTAATTAVNTIQGSTGSCTFTDCYLRMVTTAGIVAATQPSVISVTGAGSAYISLGSIDYLHTGNCGAGAMKSALLVGTGGLIEVSRNSNANVTCSGTAGATGLAIDLAATGNINIYTSVVNVTDPDATIVTGVGYLGGVGTSHEYFRNNIHVIVGAANTGYGFYAADTASISRFFYNHIHVEDAGGTSYSYHIGAAATVISHFDDMVAADGISLSPTGLFYEISSETDGDLTIQGPSAAATRTLTVANTDNTATASNAGVEISVGGATSTGDPYVNFLVTGAGTYSVGIDNTVANDPFKITSGATPSAGTDLLTMTSVGDASFSGTVTAGTGFSATTGDVEILAGDLWLWDKTNTDTAANILYYKDRSSGTVITGDSLGDIQFRGYDSSSYIEGASIKAVSTGTIGVDRVPTKIDFYTHSDAVVGTPTKRMTLDEHGALTVHQNTASASFISTNNGLALTAAYYINSADSATIAFNKSRGGITAVNSGDDIGVIGFLAADGTALVPSAAIEAVVSGTIGVNRVPSQLKFYTHSDAVVGAPTKRMTLQEDGTLYIEETDAAANPGIISDNSVSYVSLYQKNDVVGSQNIFRKSRGAPYTIVQAGDTLGSLQFKGADGVHWHTGASILVVARGTVGAGRVPASMTFYTHPDAIAATASVRMDINEHGNVRIYAPDAGVGLTVSGGGITSTGTTTLSSLGVGIMRTSAAGVVSSTNGANGQVLVGGAATPTWANITSTDDSITVTNGAGTIDLSGNGIPWVNVTGATQAMAVNTGYIANRVAGNVAFTLPAAAAIGDVIAVTGSQNGWTIAQNAGQTIHLLGSSTTTGVGGSLASTIRYNCIELVCVVTDSDFVMRHVAGNITVV